MALDSTPWFVGGGAQHSPEVARSLAYAATNGAEGVAGVYDLKVRAQDVPNGTVRIDTGGALLLNRYPGGTGQSYSLRNATATDRDVAATGSGGGRTDAVVARVLDPQYEGNPPADPLAFDYSRLEVIQGVPAGMTHARELNLGYPAVALARIAMPVSTATVTQGMITDLRQVAQPRSVRTILMGGPTPEDTLTVVGGQKWPDYRPTIEVPEWATHVAIIANIASIGVRNGSCSGILANTLGDSPDGQFRSANTEYDVDVAPGDGARFTFIVGGKGAINPAFRGTRQVLGVEGSRAAFTNSGGLVTVKGSHIVFDVEFTEEAV